ncbi:Glycerophosphodiester phosphodiesterase [Suhomyces tanzawaensis NRRL Y-17324]|uniref:Glycerophosphodiester phosphodiesterase n=1 Tax=Suhomyces tanzawaensis NRRL Y-17324 TaxID=984487 RepID=A0A1E4SQZ4_9ASCO|nr:Glycerophosphodiester phosphodiesterase [Suhomyces tanzawaensis NRRL Y-17324]ODV81921.1 Glycerophosphodiester phosphodiesterase [Suhomyces tanzawaensis NRRL Y-17324]
MSYTSPVITGHRGFKANYTENTLLGFDKCYQTGATVIETDLWLSRDQVIVISHDVTTKRIFVDADGNETNYNILETSYEDTLRHLRTTSGELLLTFQDVLRWFVQYIDDHDSNSHKLQLDIKRLNPTKILKHLISDLLAVRNDIAWWYHRIQFGIWDLRFIKYLNQEDFFREHFPGTPNALGYSQFDVFHISLSWKDSIHYINYNFYLDALSELKKDNLYRVRITGVSLLYVLTWSPQFVTKFVPLLRIQRLKLYSWTINTIPQYDYLAKIGSAANLVEYGIITDHPDVMSDHKNDKEHSERDQLARDLEKLKTYSTCDEAYSEEGELRIQVSLKQRFVYFLFSTFQAFTNMRAVTPEEKQYDSYVDENRIIPAKDNLFFRWVFQKCQKVGIF